MDPYLRLCLFLSFYPVPFKIHLSPLPIFKVAICDHLSFFFLSQLKHKIFRKLLDIVFYYLYFLITSSNIDRAVSASFFVTINGGINLMELGPQPRRSKPFCKHLFIISPLSFSALSLVSLSFTSSTPIIKPFPLTSPIIPYLFFMVSSFLSIKLPTTRAFSIKHSSRSFIVSSAASQDTGLPPNVLACEPGPQSIISDDAIVIPSGKPEAIPFAIATISCITPKCSDASSFPVLPIPD